MKNIILIILLGISTANPIWADSIIVSGTVTDDAGKPLLGANVLILDTHYGAAAAKNGSYSIHVPIAESGRQITLVARFMGYKPQTLKVLLSDGAVTADFHLEEDVLQLRPIIVSAQKRQQDIQRVPISITALSNHEISQLNSDRINDLAYAIPNFRLSRDQRNSTLAVDMRGVSGRSRNIGVEGRAGVYVDGVYMGRSCTANQDLLDLEAVEILRGPQGTLFGKNTVSGAISLRTIQPHSQLAGKINIEAGNFNHIKTIGTLNVPLYENKLFAKISAKKFNRKGFIKNIYDNTYLNGVNTYSGRVQFRFLASSKLVMNLDINGVYDRDENNTNCIGLTGPSYDAAPGPRQVSHDADEYEHRELFSSAVTMDYELPQGYSLKSITSYHRNEWDQLSEEDYSPIFVAISYWNEENNHFTQEIQLTSSRSKTFDFVGGVFYFYQISKTGTNAIGGEDFVIPNYFIETFGNVKTESIAGYVNGNWHLTNRITINGGLRYTLEAKKIKYSIINKPSPGLFVDLDNFRDDFSEGVFSPRGAINISVGDNSMIYGAVARAYKSGGWNAEFLSTQEQFRFRSEFATNYELGLKSTMWNNRLRFNAALFLTKFTDFQVHQFLYAANGTHLILTNASKVTTKGFELELSALPLPDIKLTSNLEFANAKFDEFKNGGPNGEHYDGHKLPWAPEIQVNVALDFHKRIGSAGRLIAHGDVAYTDEYFSNPNNDPIDCLINDYYLLNARIGFEFKDEHWGIFLWGKNLTDELYITYRDKSFLKVPRAWYGMPRTYGIQVSYRFLK